MQNQPRCVEQSGFLVGSRACPVVYSCWYVKLSCESVFNSWYAISKYFGWLYLLSFFSGFTVNQHWRSANNMCCSLRITYCTLLRHRLSRAFSTPSCGGFRRINLPNIILSKVPCFKVSLSSNKVKKRAFIRPVLTLFKSAKKTTITGMLYAFIYTSYRWLDTLPTTVPVLLIVDNNNNIAKVQW